MKSQRKICVVLLARLMRKLGVAALAITNTENPNRIGATVKYMGWDPTNLQEAPLVLASEAAPIALALWSLHYGTPIQHGHKVCVFVLRPDKGLDVTTAEANVPALKIISDDSRF